MSLLNPLSFVNGGSITIDPPPPPPPPATFFVSGDTPKAAGTSIPYGIGASTTANDYVHRLNTQYSVTFNNTVFATPGWGFDEMNRSINQNLSIGNNQPALIDCGINDIIAMGSVKPFMNEKFKYATIAAISSFLLESVTTATDLTVVGTGTRADLANTFGQRSQFITGKNAQSFNGLNYKIQHVFSGTHILLNIIGTNGTTYTSPQFSVKVDGVLQETLNVNGWAEGLTNATSTGTAQAFGFVYSGFSSGSHTLEIEILEAGKDLRIDFVGQLQSTSVARGVLVIAQPHLTAAYYATTGTADSDAMIDGYNTYLDAAKTVFSSLGYDVIYVDVNAGGYNPNTMSNDGIHPNDTGHLKYKDIIVLAVA